MTDENTTLPPEDLNPGAEGDAPKTEAPVETQVEAPAAPAEAPTAETPVAEPEAPAVEEPTAEPVADIEIKPAATEAPVEKPVEAPTPVEAPAAEPEAPAAEPEAPADEPETPADEPETPAAEPVAPATTETPAPTPESPSMEGLLEPTEEEKEEESFFKKNKLLIIGGVIGIILIAVTVGVLLGYKDSENLEGMINKVMQEQESQQMTAQSETAIQEALEVEVFEEVARPKVKVKVN